MPLAELIARFDPELPIARAHTPPGAWYTSPELYALERSFLADAFRPICRQDALDAPGAFTSGCALGEPYVVVKQANGALKAMSNVCRHKGREVVTQDGQGPLVCGYHGWRYGLDGRLESAPKMAGIEDFDRSAMSLPEIPTETFGPWLVVGEHPHLAPLVERLDQSGWGELRYHSSVRWEIACNWKVYVDNYLDGGYHVPHMHPSLAAQIDMSTYGTELFERYSIQSSAPNDAHARIGDEAVYVWIYPFFMLNRYGRCLDSNLVIPRGPERCEVHYDFFFDENMSEDEIRASIAQSAVTQREDIEICESVQRGVGSARYDVGRYAPRLEQGEHHFHRLLAADYQRALAEHAEKQ